MFTICNSNEITTSSSTTDDAVMAVMPNNELEHERSGSEGIQ